MAGNEPRACGRPLQHAPALDHLKSSSMPVTSIGVASASETGGPAEETIVWEGWLDKQDPNGILYKQWKRRYFKLTDQALTYAKTDRPECSLLRRITLDRVKEVCKIQGTGRFQVATSYFQADEKPRMYRLQAATDTQATEWIEAFSAASNTYKAQRSLQRRSTVRSEPSTVRSELSLSRAIYEDSDSVPNPPSPPQDSPGAISVAPPTVPWMPRLSSAESASSGEDSSDEDWDEGACDAGSPSLASGGQRNRSSLPVTSLSLSPPPTPAPAKATLTRVFSNKIKTIVSKKKKRFDEDGFNLDLSYVTPAIIAMGFPAEGVEGVYRNKFADVYRLLESRHCDCYKLYNLCSERTYDPKKFHGRVEFFPFDDHSPPPFEIMRPFCINARDWFELDSLNVIAVHCKAGKGRTGTMICALLLHLGVCQTAQEAMELFAAARTQDGKGVTIPSQQRYIHYFAANLGAEREIVSTLLTGLVLRFPPKGAVTIIVTITNGHTHVRAETKVDANASQVVVRLPNHGVALSGDFCVRIDYEKQGSFSLSAVYNKLCHGWLHTSFAGPRDSVETPVGAGPAGVVEPGQAYTHTLFKQELDGAVRKDKRDEQFHAALALDLNLQLPDPRTKPMWRLHHPASGIINVAGSDQSLELECDAHGQLRMHGCQGLRGKSPADTLAALGLEDEAGAAMRSESIHAAGVAGDRTANETQRAACRPPASDAAARANARPLPATPALAGKKPLSRAVILYDYVVNMDDLSEGAGSGGAQQHLRLRSNDVVAVLQKDDSTHEGTTGWFPQRYCVEID